MAHLRMRPVSRRNSRRSLVLVPRAEDHDFSVLLLIRTRCPDTSSKATLWMKALHEGAQVALVETNLLALQETHPDTPSLGQESPWRRACDPLQYSCLENPKDRGAWRATVHGVAKSWTQLTWLNTGASQNVQDWQPKASRCTRTTAIALPLGRPLCHHQPDSEKGLKWLAHSRKEQKRKHYREQESNAACL